jgi:hypothetical protein
VNGQGVEEPFLLVGIEDVRLFLFRPLRHSEQGRLLLKPGFAIHIAPEAGGEGQDTSDGRQFAGDGAAGNACLAAMLNVSGQRPLVDLRESEVANPRVELNDALGISAQGLLGFCLKIMSSGDSEGTIFRRRVTAAR